MVKNKMYRILAMAVVLTALFALTAFADLMGGMGEILGLEAGKSYKAASVTINAEGTGAAYDETKAFALDNTTNTGLAGLYYVTSDNFATKTLIYVYGSHAERATVTAKTGDIWPSKNNLDGFYPGFYSGTAVRSPNGDIGKKYVSTWGDNLSKTVVANYANAAEDKKSGLFKTTIADVLQTKTFKYALTAKQIIPISLVSSYKFAVNAIECSFTYADLDMKFDVHVMNKNGEINTYSYVCRKDTSFGSGMSSNAIVDFTAADAWSPKLPAEGYFVAFTYYPFYGLKDESKFTVKSTTSNVRTTFTPGAYSINEPKKLAAPIPAVTFKNNTLTWNADNVKLVRYSLDPAVNGTGEIALDGAKTYTFNPATEAGLWALYTPATDVYAESAKTLVYVRGAYIDRKQLGEQSDGKAYGEGNLKSSSNITLEEGRLQRPSAFWASTNGGAVHAPGTYYDSVSNSDASSALLKDYAKAKTAYLEDASEANKNALQTAFDNILYNGDGIGVKEIYYSYVLTKKEIIPISEVTSYKFGLLRSKQNYFDYAGNKVKFVAYVADENGNVGEYVQYHTYDLGGSEKTITIDFADRTKWSPALPEDGYFVRFVVYPYEGLEDCTKLNVNTGSANSQLKYRFYCDNSGYVIYEPQKPVAPTPNVRVNGTVISGLEASKTYEIVPFNINGADSGEENANVETVSGVASVDLAALYTTPVGLYAVKSLESDFYKESAMVLAYVYGSHDARLALGQRVEDESLSTYGHWMAVASNAGFVPGYFSGTGVLKHHSANPKDSVGTYGNHLGKSDAGDYVAGTKTFAQIAEILTGITFNYALDSDEIIPVSLVNSYRFTLNSGEAAFSYTNLDVKFDVYVMNENGELNTFSYVHTDELFAAGNTEAVVVDFNKADGWKNGAPTGGYFVGYTLYPYYGFNNEANLTMKSNAKNFNTRISMYPGVYSINDRPIVDVEGISLILGGEIGAKVVFEYNPEEVKAATLVIEGLAPITATLEDGKGEVIVPFYPRLVNTLSYTGSLVCTKTDDSEGTVAIKDISVKNYIEYMQQNPEDYAEWIDLIDALEVYCDYAEDYFREGEATLADLSLEAEEAAFVADNSNRSLDGAMTGVAFHSTSLVLLDTMTIRHYFTVGDTVNLGSITVNGATSLTEATVEKDATSRYAYVDVASISADKLDEEQIVTLTLGEETITIKFSAMDYAELTIGDADSKLANLAKAIAKYAYAASQIK